MTSPPVRPPVRPRAVPLELLARPLDFLVAEHQRQKEMCLLLEAVADGREWGKGLAEHLVLFLTDEMALHRADEEDDLFDLMRRRCSRDDDIGSLIHRVWSPEQADEEVQLSTHLLDRLASNRTDCREAFAERAHRYVALLRLHVAYTNGILIPLGRRRLRSSDLAGLAKRMRRRRGLPSQIPG